MCKKKLSWIYLAGSTQLDLDIIIDFWGIEGRILILYLKCTIVYLQEDGAEMRLGEWQTHVRLLYPFPVLQPFHGIYETVSPDRLTKRVRHFTQTFSREYVFYKNGPSPATSSFIFCLFKQTIQFLQQMYVKNVHPV